ncbi:hypothetical protein CHUAL_007759 [Chamberlinius hualienensis]
MRRTEQRRVPGFSVQALQKNTIVCKPPSANCKKERLIGATSFRRFYERGDFPLMISHANKGNKITWKAEFSHLDYDYLLPLFFDGLCEVVYPYEFIARQGIDDLISNGPDKVLPLLPKIIPHLRKALNTRNRQVIETTLKILQNMVKNIDGFGVQLVQHYKQILPILNIFKNQNRE